jgi:tRNA(Ile)-lysidine synthase
MLERVAAFMSRFGMVFPGARIGAAVSGGADSVCLLYVLRELAPRWNLRLSVVHVDHGMRGDASRADAAFVRELAAGFGLPLHLRTADVPALAERTRDNLEQAARELRRSFFSELIRAGAADRVATAHTRDDQAETVLFRLLRGSGTAGLSGIHPVSGNDVVRPLLDVSREEVLEYLRARRIEWREDESNRDLSYARNRIRHQLLPLLREQYNPLIGEALVRIACLASEDEEYWRGIIPEAPLRDGAILLKADDLAGMPPALARRFVRRCIAAIKGDLRQVGFEHVDAILELAGAPEGRGRFRFAGMEIWRSFDWIRFTRATPTVARPDYDLRVEVPGRVAIPEQKCWLHFDLRTANRGSCDTVENELNWERTLALIESSGVTLAIRNWRPGDRYQPATGRNEKIKQMFQDCRVPVWERAAWPVLTVGEQIVWSRRFGAAAAFAPDENTSTLLQVREEYVVPV